MRRPLLAVAVPFPVWPPSGGGQVRVHQLYRRLAAWFDVELVCLEPGGQSSRTQIAPGYRQIVVGASAMHRAEEHQLSEARGRIPLTDVVMPLLISHTPDFGRAFLDAASRANVQIASHPYAATVMRPFAAYLPLVYEAHNVEVDLKSHVFGWDQEAVELVEAVERWCATAAAQVFACSTADAQALAQRYQVPPERIALVPNGVDVQEIPYLGPDERARWRRSERARRPVALFLGSFHPPNVAAARRVLEIAAHVKEMDFTIVGSVGRALEGTPLPPNVTVTGQVLAERKTELLQLADVALNPLESGSGTSLKAIEYCAAGLPVISTPAGMRGLPELTPHCVVAPLERLEDELRHLVERPPAARGDPAAARRAVETHYSWDRIAARARDLLLPVLSR